MATFFLFFSVVNIGTLAAGATSSYYSAIGTLSQQIDSLVGRSSGTYWNSGGLAPQYVQLTFPSSFSVSQICLCVAQLPNGNTYHELYAGPSSSSLTLVTVLNGYTYSGEWINITYNPMLTGVSVLQLYTVSSPSWVAWVYFLVYGV